MEKLNILLCYGTRMSSSSLAQQMRSVTKKQGIMTRMEARSQNNIADDLPKTDVLLIGPHLSYAFDELEAMYDPYAVPVLVISEDMYAGLDEEGLLALYVETLKEKEQSYEYVH